MSGKKTEQEFKSHLRVKEIVYKEMLHMYLRAYLHSGCGNVTAGKAAAGWDAHISTERAACSF